MKANTLFIIFFSLSLVVFSCNYKEVAEYKLVHEATIGIFSKTENKWLTDIIYDTIRINARNDEEAYLEAYRHISSRHLTFFRRLQTYDSKIEDDQIKTSVTYKLLKNGEDILPLIDITERRQKEEKVWEDEKAFHKKHITKEFNIDTISPPQITQFYEYR